MDQHLSKEDDQRAHAWKDTQYYQPGKDDQNQDDIITFTEITRV